jgi:hypothetical protein
MNIISISFETSARLTTNRGIFAASPAFSVPHSHAEHTFPKSARSDVLLLPVDDNGDAFLGYNPAISQLPLLALIKKSHLIP